MEKTTVELPSMYGDHHVIEVRRILLETGEAAYKGSNGDSREFVRHTAVFEQTQEGVSFTQEVSYAGRPLWPCPGMGVVKQVEINE